MRCVMCNNPLKPSEIIWYPKEQRHEDLCRKCRVNIFRDLLDLGYEQTTHFPVSDEEIEDET